MNNENSSSRASTLSNLEKLWNEIFTEATTKTEIGVQSAYTVSQNQTEVSSCGTPVRGEDYDCASPKVRCGTTSVMLPKGSKVKSIVREVREAAGGDWKEDPKIGLGWCDWTALDDDVMHDGRRKISVTLKNWSHNRNRLVRLTVVYWP